MSHHWVCYLLNWKDKAVRDKAAKVQCRSCPLKIFLGFRNISHMILSERKHSYYVKQRVDMPQLDLFKETDLIILTSLFGKIP